MDLIIIHSYKELQDQLKETPTAYLLLYKSGTETSDCALLNVQGIKKEDSMFMIADVNVVRDIHTEYGVKTAPILLGFQKGILQNSYKGCNDVSFYEKILQQDYYVVDTDEERKPQKRVIVYSTPSCSWCTTLKKHLDHHGIRYRDIDIARDTKAAEEMQKRSGQQGVPQIDISGQMIVGFDKNKINTLLGI